MALKGSLHWCNTPWIDCLRCANAATVDHLFVFFYFCVQLSLIPFTTLSVQGGEIGSLNRGFVEEQEEASEEEEYERIDAHLRTLLS